MKKICMSRLSSRRMQLAACGNVHCALEHFCTMPVRFSVHFWSGPNMVKLVGQNAAQIRSMIFDLLCDRQQYLVHEAPAAPSSSRVQARGLLFSVIKWFQYASIMIVELMELHPNSCHSGKPSSATEDHRSPSQSLTSNIKTRKRWADMEDEAERKHGCTATSLK